MAQQPEPSTSVTFSIETRQKIGKTLRLTVSTTLRYEAEEALVVERLQQPIFLKVDLSEAGVALMLEREKELEGRIAQLERDLAFKQAEVAQLRVASFGSRLK